jgi:hypothetical protein
MLLFQKRRKKINQLLLIEHQLVFFYWLTVVNRSIVSLRSCSCERCRTTPELIIVIAIEQKEEKESKKMETKNKERNENS